MPHLRRGAMRDAIESLVRRVAEEHGVLPHAIYSPTTRPRVVRARDHVLALLRWSTGFSFPELGDLFAMDHTSIVAAVRRHEKRINP